LKPFTKGSNTVAQLNAGSKLLVGRCWCKIKLNATSRYSYKWPRWDRRWNSYSKFFYYVYVVISGATEYLIAFIK